MEGHMAKLTTYSQDRPAGILDEDLASILEIPTRHLNQALKRNALNFERNGLGYRMTAEEYRQASLDQGRPLNTWGGRRRSTPMVYTFKGACLVLGRLRLLLQPFQQQQLLKLFGEESIQVYDYGSGRLEEHIMVRIKNLLREIARVDIHHSVSCAGVEYRIDVYLPDHRSLSK
jgi:hypothetical protein